MIYKRNVIIGFIIFLAFGYFVQDYLQIFSNITLNKNAKIYSASATLLVSFLCSTIVWITGDKYFEKKDIFKLKIAFVVSFIADILLNLDANLFNNNKYIKSIGIIAFMIFQVIIIHRNGTGFKTYIKSSGFKKDISSFLIYSVLILAVDTFIIIKVFLPHYHDLKLMFSLVLLIYTALVSTSLWVAWANSRIGFFCGVNSVLITVGMTLFYMCDMCVGINIIEGGSSIAGHAVWLFYTPALMLMSLSGYKFKNNTDL